MNRILLDLQYLPPVAYFSIIQQADEIWIETRENFIKQTYRNRCRILTSHGAQDLSIPIQHTSPKVAIRELLIDYKQKWMNNHWRSIQSAYGKSPFFDYYSEELEQVILSRKESLFDLNWQLLTICLKYLGLQHKPLHQTTVYQHDTENGLIDLRSAIHPKLPLPDWFQPSPYHQIFGSNFAANLSVIDLLFCTGPEANMLLGQSCVTD